MRQKGVGRNSSGAFGDVPTAAVFGAAGLVIRSLLVPNLRWPVIGTGPRDKGIDE